MHGFADPDDGSYAVDGPPLFLGSVPALGDHASTYLPRSTVQDVPRAWSNPTTQTLQGADLQKVMDENTPYAHTLQGADLEAAMKGHKASAPEEMPPALASVGWTGKMAPEPGASAQDAPPMWANNRSSDRSAEPSIGAYVHGPSLLRALGDAPLGTQKTINQETFARDERGWKLAGVQGYKTSGPDLTQWAPGEREALGTAIRTHDAADANPRAAAAPIAAPLNETVIPKNLTDVGVINRSAKSDRADLAPPLAAQPALPATPASAPLGEAPLDRPLAGRQAVASSVAGEFKNAGMSDNGIGGILANTKDESGFDAGMRVADQPRWGGEAHFAHGLFQMGGQEWNNYAKWLEENHTGADWRDPKLQTQFMVQNLKENYPAVWDRMNRAATPGEAAQIFAAGYLKPRADLLQARSDRYAQGVPDVGGFLKGLAGGAQSVVGGLGQGVSRVGEGITSLSGTRNEAPAETRGTAPQYTGALGFLNALGVPIPDSVGRVATSLNSMAPILAYAGANKLPNYYGEYQPTQAKLGMEHAQLGPNIAHTQAQTALAQAQTYTPHPTSTTSVRDDYGQLVPVHQYGVFNPADPAHPTPVGSPAAAASSPASGQVGGNVYNTEGKTEEQYLASLPRPIADKAKEIYYYRQVPYTGRYAQPGTPGAIVMDAVNGLANIHGDPYEAQKYGTIQKAQKDWETAGKNTQTLETGNTSIGHLWQQASNYDDLHNSGWNGWNAIANRAQALKSFPALSAFEGSSSKVAEELTSFYRNAGGAEADIKRELKTVSDAATPEEAHRAIGNIAEMVLSKVDALKQKRDVAFPHGEGERKYPILTPDSVSYLKQLAAWSRDPTATIAQINANPEKYGVDHVTPPLEKILPVQQGKAGSKAAPQQTAPIGQPQSGSYTEGQTATGKDGARIVFQGGSWRPVQ